MGLLRRYLAGLRRPNLFLIAVALMLLSWLWPFDPIPWVDEVLTLVLTLLLMRRKLPAQGDRAGNGGVDA